MLARVPWTPPVKSKPKAKRLTKEKRRHLVNTTAFVLKLGEPTRFAFEGFCRHDLRGRLCLEGWGWKEADIAAADIIATALNMIGARRPTWQEGQPEHTQAGVVMSDRLRCLQCEGILDPENKTFCSSRCRRAYHMRRHYQDNIEAERAKQRLRWKAWSERQPEEDCDECGNSFRPNYPGQRLCGKRCAVVRMKRARRMSNVRS